MTHTDVKLGECLLCDESDKLSQCEIVRCPCVFNMTPPTYKFDFLKINQYNQFKDSEQLVRQKTWRVHDLQMSIWRPYDSSYIQVQFFKKLPNEFNLKIGVKFSEKNHATYVLCTENVDMTSFYLSVHTSRTTKIAMLYNSILNTIIDLSDKYI